MAGKIIPTSVAQFDENSWINGFNIDQRDRSLRSCEFHRRCHHSKCHQGNVEASHLPNQSGIVTTSTESVFAMRSSRSRALFSGTVKKGHPRASKSISCARGLAVPAVHMTL